MGPLFSLEPGGLTESTQSWHLKHTTIILLTMTGVVGGLNHVRCRLGQCQTTAFKI